MKIFTIGNNYEIKLDTLEVGIISEFKAILDSENNIDEHKGWAVGIFKYIYLTQDFASPYRQYSEADCHIEALKDSKCKEVDVRSPLVIAAIKKYSEIKNSNKVLKSIRAIYKSIDALDDYLSTVNFHEKIKEGAHKGKSLHDPKQLMSVIKDYKYLLDTIKEYEKRAKEEMAEENEIKARGDKKIGRIR